MKIRVLVVSISLFAAMAVAQSPTRLQVFASPDESKAQAVKDQLDKLGFGPARVVQEQSLYKVQTKAFDSYGEANLQKPYLVGQGFNGAFSVADEAAAPATAQTAFQDNVLPSVVSSGAFNQEKFDFTITKPKYKATGITPALARLSNDTASENDLFQKAFSYNKLSQASDALAALDAHIKRFPNSERANDVKLKKAYWLVSAGDLPAATEAFFQIAEAAPTDVIAGEATLRLGYLAIKEKNYPHALRLFHTVASGKIPSEPEVQVEATLRTAALFHRGKDHESADRCYALIQNKTDDPNLRAFTGVHRAGIALEQAWNGKGTFAQAREMCDQILADMPGAPKSLRATACIMAIETLAYEKNYKQLLRREAQVRAELNGTPEQALGTYWIAKAKLETGDVRAAAGMLEELTKADKAATKRFAAVDVRSQARRLSADAYERLGNKAKAAELRAKKE